MRYLLLGVNNFKIVPRINQNSLQLVFWYLSDVLLVFRKEEQGIRILVVESRGKLYTDIDTPDEVL